MNKSELNAFLEGVEKKALTITKMHTKNVDDAFDIIQEAMISFVSNYEELNKDEAQKVFYKILQNKINDWHRKSKSFFNIFSKSEEVNDSGKLVDFDNPEKIYEKDQMFSRFKESLNNLSQRQKEVFLLKNIENFTLKEVAEIIDCSESTAKTHYQRAVEILETEIKGDSYAQTA